MDSSMQVGVIGAGTMGAGIAQVAAQAGHTTYLYDARPGATDQALTALRSTLDKLVAKGKMNAETSAALIARIVPVADLSRFAPCCLVIEAVIEDLRIKRELFAQLDRAVDVHAVLATNTSSLPVTAIAAGVEHPERVLGLHFFNPAPLLPLVEVVPGLATAPSHVEAAAERMRAWGKSPVVCKDTPGFIVNRVARPFYGESIRIFEEGIADMATIDAALKQYGGFRMGPFELMDLIGNDINFTVTRTVFEAFFFDPRYKPSLTQQRQVESGRLGRKTGRGYYSYGPNDTPPAREVAPGLGESILERVLAMLINEAADALFWKVAAAADIDLAMTKGVNYPKGLLAWADEKGAAHWLRVLEGLQATYGEDRYRPSPLLRRAAGSGGKLIP
jgi:3-hydroxybutyryl-CoA dehydrogenase